MTKRNKTQTLLWNNAGFNFGWDGNAHLELGFTLQVISGIQSWTGSLSLTRSWPWLGQGYTRTDKKLRSSSQSLLAAFHTAMTTQHFGYNFQDKTDRFRGDPQDQVLCITHILHIWLPLPQWRSSLSSHTRWFHKCMLDSTALHSPASACWKIRAEGLLFAPQSAQLLEKRYWHKATEVALVTWGGG